MKQTTQITAYSFNHTAGTVTFTGYGSINLNQIVAIFNATRGVMLYNPGGSGMTGTVATNVLTLTVSTSAMSDTDQLLIYYNDPTVAAKVDGSGVTQPVSIVSGSVTSSPAVDTTPATQTVTAVDSASTSTTEQGGQIAVTGTPSANSAASFSLASLASAQVELSGTWVGTLDIEVSFNGGTTWYQRGIHQAGTPYVTSNFTANGAGNLNAAGVTNLRVRATAWVSGTATVRVVGSLNQSTVYIANSLEISDPTTPTQRLAIDASGRPTVNVNGTVPVSGTVTANAGTNMSTAALALETGGNLATVATAQGAAGTGLTQPTGGSGIIGFLSGIYAALKNLTFDGSNFLKVNVATIANVVLAAGTNFIGYVGNQVSTTGGWTPYFVNVVKATVVTVSGSAGKFGGCALMNLDSAPVYLQCFDTTASVTPGTTTPTFIIPIPANSTPANGVADRFNLGDVGCNLANGLKIIATSNTAGSAASTNGISGSIWYK